MSKTKKTIILTHVATGTVEPWSTLPKLFDGHPEIDDTSIYDETFPFERNGYRFEKYLNNVVRDKIDVNSIKYRTERIIEDAALIAEYCRKVNN